MTKSVFVRVREELRAREARLSLLERHAREDEWDNAWADQDEENETQTPAPDPTKPARPDWAGSVPPRFQVAQFHGTPGDVYALFDPDTESRLIHGGDPRLEGGRIDDAAQQHTERGGKITWHPPGEIPEGFWRQANLSFSHIPPYRGGRTTRWNLLRALRDPQKQAQFSEAEGYLEPLEAPAPRDAGGLRLAEQPKQSTSVEKALAGIHEAPAGPALQSALQADETATDVTSNLNRKYFTSIVPPKEQDEWDRAQRASKQSIQIITPSEEARRARNRAGVWTPSGADGNGHHPPGTDGGASPAKTTGPRLAPTASGSAAMPTGYRIPEVPPGTTPPLSGPKGPRV